MASEYKQALKKPVIRRTIILGIFVLITVSILDYIYKPEPADVLVEAHGLVFDILFFGLLLAVYEVVINQRREKKLKELEEERKIERYFEEIDDYRYWKESEASYRIRGILKRLNKLGIDKFDLNDCFLQNSIFNSWEFKNSRFDRAILSGSLFLRSKFTKCEFVATDFAEAVFSEFDKEKSNWNQTQFIECDFSNAKLKKISAMNVEFNDCVFDKTEFYNSNLVGSKFINCNFNDTDGQTIVEGFESSNLSMSIFKKCKFVNIRQNDLSNLKFENCEFITMPNSLKNK